MKALALIAFMSFMTNSYAGPNKVEFDEATEIKCYKEAQALGCVPGSEEADSECVKAKKSKLSSICSKLLKEKL